MRGRLTVCLAALALLVTTAACAGDDGEELSLTVGSANFTESIVLGEIYAQALEAEGYTVEKRLNVGAREVYFPALERGDIDLLPEYTGSLLSFLTKQKVTASADSEKTLTDLKESSRTASPHSTCRKHRTRTASSPTSRPPRSTS